MSAFNTVLARARKYRRTGPHSAVISCPAPGHEDRNPSVTVSETPDGTILMNCRSRGCDFANMVAGLGMEMHEFFPPRLNVTGDFRPALKRITPAGDLLAAVVDEILLSIIVIKDFHSWLLDGKGAWPDGTTTERLGQAFARIQAAADEATGRKIDVEAERDEILKAAQLRPQEIEDLEHLRDHGVTLSRKQQQKEVA